MKLREKTVPYRTWVKRSIVESMGRVFRAHVDEILRTTKVSIEYPNEKAAYPAVIVRFFERDISNAGIGHEEILTIDENDYRFKHYFYTGDVEFAIHALSSLDRDLISDSLVQTLGMGELTEYTNHFFSRLYGADTSEFPEAEFNYINLNTDRISGFGESQSQAPWLAEDALVYQTSFRCGVFGEFYSLPPVTSDALDFVDEVDVYPYIEDIEPVPEGADDPAEWGVPLELDD